ncbi:MAG: isoamylase early set domain-containing protein [Gemmatimonadetes bacterium]|nr:isoamylase early set domain-containing protein [Gemmatimonadota bacterium]
MIQYRVFSPDAQAYLDGDIDHLSDEHAQAAAEHFSQTVAQYNDSLEVPGREVDRAVMAVLREQQRSPARRKSLWRWFVQPQNFTLRPVLAAAVVVVAVGLSAGIVWDRGGTAPEVAADFASSTVFVQFELRAPDAQRVSLAGSFNDWDGDAIPLVRSSSATDIWTVTLPLEPGEHQYLFVIDGERWMPDPRAHAQVDDGFGQSNSVITVGPRGLIRS